MKHTEVKLVPLTPRDREQFILDSQEAFKFGAVEFFCEHNQDPNATEEESEGPDEMFRFVKRMR